MAIPTDDRQHQKNSKADSPLTQSQETQAKSSYSRVQEHAAQLINQSQPGTSGQYEALQENLPQQNRTRKPSPKKHHSTSLKLSSNHEILSLGQTEYDLISSEAPGLRHPETPLPKLLIPPFHSPIRFHPPPHSPLSMHPSGSPKLPHHLNLPLPHLRHPHPPPRHHFPPPPHLQMDPRFPRPHFHHPRPHHHPPGHHKPGDQQSKPRFPTSLDRVRNLFSPKIPPPSSSSSSVSEAPAVTQSPPFSFAQRFKCPLSQ